MSITKETIKTHDAMCVADEVVRNVEIGLPSTPQEDALIILAAEVRELRNATSLLREENERLRKYKTEAQKLMWLIHGRRGEFMV